MVNLWLFLFQVKLTRRYRKALLRGRRPATLSEAMKAQLYFAPPGVDVSQYTAAILKLFEHYRKRLFTAQSRLLDRIEWGPPIMPGLRQTDSLDALRTSDTSEKSKGPATHGGNS